LGYYFALGQVGLEMAAPVAIGVGLDSYFGWSPWAAVVGATFGLIAGLAHLVMLLNRNERSDLRGPKQDS
jgi:F0F1-type ATP synthase assembly protein I